MGVEGEGGERHSYHLRSTHREAFISSQTNAQEMQQCYPRLTHRGRSHCIPKQPTGRALTVPRTDPHEKLSSHPTPTHKESFHSNPDQLTGKQSYHRKPAHRGCTHPTPDQQQGKLWSHHRPTHRGIIHNTHPLGRE